jgi:hypothetical protein
MRGLAGLKALALGVAVALLLTGLDLASGARISANRVAVRCAFALVAILVGWASTPWAGKHWWLWAGGLPLVAAALVAAYATWHSTELGLAALAVAYGSLIVLDSSFQAAFSTLKGKRARQIATWSVRVILAGSGGLAPMALTQTETRFAEEEFFALVLGLLLAGITLLLLSGFATLGLGPKVDPEVPRPKFAVRALALILAIALAGGWVWLGARTLAAYRASFGPPTAPGYAGIERGSPFLCGQVPSEPSTPSGETVYWRALQQVEEWPEMGSPELALLAVGSGAQEQAEAFRKALLVEAQSGAFTGAAHSVKSTQYDAARRLYFMALVQDHFPDLFSTSDQAVLREWFELVNDRAWQTEWVDLFYGLAYGKPPDGPYENQEIGAGLLALLEDKGMASPTWSEANRAYLAQAGLGWGQWFRNPDDAFLYQAVWINNAAFQDLLRNSSRENRRQAFEWLLLQALPDGEPLSYDHPALAPLVATWYQGAQMLSDGRFVWLADRSLSRVEAKGTGLAANPGLERPLSLEGRSPTAGSCLIYGDSGLPLQPGPLAPDKVVFRDGWEGDSAYLLLNLRFSGWHRYKATNSIILAYQDGPLVVESDEGQSIRWLPLGREAYRDKRIAREDLNGLLIPREGLDGAVQILTGQGSAWAQDPPHYATVDSFETLGPVDTSRTTLHDWRGWMHTRSIYFIHDGPVVVVDEANSSRGGQDAALMWHVAGEAQLKTDGLWLREGDSPTRMALPASAWQTTDIQPASRNGDPGADVLYSSPQQGRLHLATAILSGEWAAAGFEANVLGSGAGQVIKVTGPTGQYTILHNHSGGLLEAEGLGSDGMAVVSWRPAGGDGWVCYVAASEVQVPGTFPLVLEQPGSSGCMSMEVAADSD